MQLSNTCSEVALLRFTLFGRAVGIRVHSSAPLWASFHSGMVTDACVSARAFGVHPGMKPREAAALVPSLQLIDEANAGALTAFPIWRLLRSFSPWIHTVGTDAFYLQISGAAPDDEAHRIIRALDRIMQDGQELRIALADNPFLARLLFQWSLMEDVPGARLRKSGKVLLHSSPPISSAGSRTAASREWWRFAPLRAVPDMPPSTVDELAHLGMWKLADLTSAPPGKLRKRFGPSALVWLSWLEQEPGGTLRVNFPDRSLKETWSAPIGDELDNSSALNLVASLCMGLSERLKAERVGTQRLTIIRRSSRHSDILARSFHKPAFRLETLLSVQDAWTPCEGVCELTLRAEQLHPLPLAQVSLTMRDNAFTLQQSANMDAIRTVDELNRKFPGALQFGMKPGFRELQVHLSTTGRPDG